VDLIKEFSIKEAAAFLKDNLTDKKSSKYWEKYLLDNPSAYLKQHGYKIICNVKNGQLCYRENTLKAFIRVMGESLARKEVHMALRYTNSKKSKKHNNHPKNRNSQNNKRNIYC
jgi:hypothetical protein